ncbi:histidine ammonia-lyase [bacterium]|nr:histidine ammonia-lyase [bacterium]
MTIYADGNSVTIDDVIAVAHNKSQVALSETTWANIRKCRAFVEEIADGDAPVYGINTGFGMLSDVKIEKSHLEDLQINLIRSHAIAVGDPFPRDVVRTIMFLRINVLAKGFSGISVATLSLLIDLLNQDICPSIPSQGSVGASGDLAPLSHLALLLVGEGFVMNHAGERVLTAEYFMQHGITPVRLKAKEGLALINGTQVMTAVAAMTIEKVRKIATLSDIALAMTIDSIQGSLKPFDKKVHELRAHKGQSETAQNIRTLLADSEINQSHHLCTKVQDAYSLRCAPQVHGSIRDALRHVEAVVTVEINSSTDNPLIFPNERETISAGNFHGEPIGLVMDYLSAAVSEIASISERRIEQLINPIFNDHIPAFLAPKKGLNSGFMIVHVTAASLASENKTLCFPATVDSIPTSAGKEDHVSMGTTAARKTAMIAENSFKVIVLELLSAAQALDFRKPLRSSDAIDAVFQEIRKVVPFMKEDYFISPQFENLYNIAESLIAVAEEKCGKLL